MFSHIDVLIRLRNLIVGNNRITDAQTMINQWLKTCMQHNQKATTLRSVDNDLDQFNKSG